jgi:hypothetical protein
MATRLGKVSGIPASSREEQSRGFQRTHFCNAPNETPFSGTAETTKRSAVASKKMEWSWRNRWSV